MATNRNSSTLVERASTQGGNDVPRGTIVLLVGAAESGPTGPVRVDSYQDGYKAFGEGSLAESIELAHRGAQYAAQGTGQSVRPNVFALRTRTGEQSEIVLKDAQGRKSVTLRSVERSARANAYRIGENRGGYRIDSPLRAEGYTVNIDKTGQPTRAASSPTKFAAAVRAAFEQEITAEVHYRQARYEVSVDGTLDGISTEQNQQVVKLGDLDDAAIAGIQITADNGDPTTMIGHEDQIDFTADGAGAHRALLGPENAKARVYSLTAGKLITAPAGAEKIRIVGLADAKRVGFQDTRTLLNIRTTGVGATAPVTLQEAGEVLGAKVSEGYEQVRRQAIGAIAPVPAAGYTFKAAVTGGSATPAITADALKITFDCAHGIAGDTAGLANLPLPYKNSAALAFGDRLGEKFSYQHPDARFLTSYKTAGAETADRPAGAYFQLELQPLGGTDFVSVPLKFGDYGENDDVTVRAKVTFLGAGKAELVLNRADYEARVGAGFADARGFVSYDSCVFELKEQPILDALNRNSPELQYFVQGNQITFNKALAFPLVIRGARVTQYRLGKDVTVDRVDGANVFRFMGEGNLPGEAGGPIGYMEAILGFDYEIEPEWPVITNAQSGDAFTGGSSGANSDPAELARAIADALTEFRSEAVVAQARFIVPVGVHVDDLVDEFDEQTGTAVERASDLLGEMVQFRDRLDAEGAAGIFYMAAKPMLPSTTRGTYTDEQIYQRFLSLTVVDSTDPARAANVLSSGSFPTFTFFDAPALCVLGARQFVSNMAPFFAGVRTILPNSTALYQLSLPAFVKPLYKFNVALEGNTRMVDVLSDPGRFNVWDPRRGEARLFSEKSGAGYLSDEQGNLVRSDLTSGYAVLAANEFRQNVSSRLEILRGPMRTNVAVLRTRVEGVLRDEARRVDGIDGLYNFDPQLNIDVYADGGKALGITIDVTVQCMGEVERIHLNVGTTGPDLNAQASSQVIPVAG